jgi:hypothetical protein
MLGKRTVRRLLFLLASLPVMLSGQAAVEASRIEMARHAFETAQQRPHLQCDFRPVAPAMNFSLRFQAGYSIGVPLKQYEGPGHRWVALSRVTPEGAQPRYFIALTKLPPVPHGVKIAGYTGGSFLLGEGSYTVETLLNDEKDRACYSQWKIQVKRRGPELALEPAIPAGAVQAMSSIRIPRNTSASPASSAPVSVFLQAAPISPRVSQLHAEDVAYLAGSLIALMEQLKEPSLRLTIFNLAQKKVLFEDDDFQIGKLDQAIRALNEIQLAVVSSNTLADGRGPLELIDAMIGRQASKAPAASTLIFLGPYAPAFGRPRAEPQVHPSAPAPLVYLQYRSPYSSVFGRGMMSGAGSDIADQWPPSMEAPPLPGLNRPLEPPDPVAAYVHAAKGETLVVRTPRDFADAIERMTPRSRSQ